MGRLSGRVLSKIAQNCIKIVKNDQTSEMRFCLSQFVMATFHESQNVRKINNLRPKATLFALLRHNIIFYTNNKNKNKNNPKYK